MSARTKEAPSMLREYGLSYPARGRGPILRLQDIPSNALKWVGPRLPEQPPCGDLKWVGLPILDPPPPGNNGVYTGVYTECLVYLFMPAGKLFHVYYTVGDSKPNRALKKSAPASKDFFGSMLVLQCGTSDSGFVRIAKEDEKYARQAAFFTTALGPNDEDWLYKINTARVRGSRRGRREEY